jgi:2'-5' RNA ligase
MSGEPPREATQRLFFALWPDSDQQVAFAHAARKVVKASGGRPVPLRDLHVTLVFLGSVAHSRGGDVRAIGRRVAGVFPSNAVPLRLAFESVEHWKKPQILAAVATENPGVSTLAAALRQASVEGGFAPDLKPFRAHVTLARKVRHAGRPPELDFVPWSFGRFALIESRTTPEGAVYSIVDSWVLAEPQND